MDEVTQEALTRYVRDLFAPEDDILRELVAESQARGMPQIHIRPEEGRMLQFLLTIIGARRVIEVGTLAGYSGLWIARSLPPDGRLITLEANPEHAEVARHFFEKAGLGQRVEVRIGPALDSLTALASEGLFDAIFIDARKEEYPAYLRWSLDHIRSGGLILAHNAFWSGAVVGAARRDDRQLQGLLSFNQAVARDPRLSATIIPVGDGIMAAIRR